MYKVLIVDDEKMIRMGMKKVLPWDELGVGEVYTAATGKEALEILDEQHPEILITDIQMTEMTGLELIEEAKKCVPDLRVIVLTGYDNFEYARQSLRLKVQDFFLKPIEEEELANAVKNQVEYLEQQKCKGAYGCSCKQTYFQSFSDSIILLCTIVKAHNRLHSLAYSDAYGKEHKSHLVDNACACQRNRLTIYGKCPIVC